MLKTIARERHPWKDRQALLAGGSQSAQPRALKASSGLRHRWLLMACVTLPLLLLVVIWLRINSGGSLSSLRGPPSFDLLAITASYGARGLSTGAPLTFEQLHSPSLSRPARGCIVYLANAAEGDVVALMQSLASLQQHFNARFKRPVIIFHEADFGPELRARVSASTPAQQHLLQFVEVALEMPEHSRQSLLWWLWEALPVMLHKRRPFSYGHMCRFFAGAMLQQPVLDGFDYHWRLDTDSRLVAPLEYDVFDFMHSRGLLYGFRQTDTENALFARGLAATTAEYARQRWLRPSLLGDWGPLRDDDLPIFFNNFEVASLHLLRSLQLQDYFAWLDASNGIYRARWGDAPIRFLQLGLFGSYGSLHHFCDVAYEHDGKRPPVMPQCARNSSFALLQDPRLARMLRNKQAREQLEEQQAAAETEAAGSRHASATASSA